ncbi:uncharacterized protein LOC128304749 [Anopheles moucheti]|uniref:uncharacterized protein LOC128304749 n=1 Tax=Anopheles moucheti TaxID=186751 RepID=UPI0022F026C2|nr:uncharacterized protein LOC128304749 [Anopheles moucheti]
MKKSTRLTVCICLLLMAITAPLVLSDETEEQEQSSQEAVVHDGQDAPAPEADTEVTDGETTDTEQQEETEGSELVQGVLPQQINILMVPAACKPGYRVDHKGKCRPSL